MRKAKELDKTPQLEENKGLMLRVGILLLAFLLTPVTVFSAIYGYEDEQGVYHMTNIRPPGGKYRVLVNDQASSTGPTRYKMFNTSAYDTIIEEHSLANGLDPHLVKAVMIAESNGNPDAVSRKGAQGLMQLMPDTALLVNCHNPFDPGENIQAGTRYLKLLYGQFKGDLELVLAAYNAGPRRVMDYNMSIPPINETVNYVKRVKHFYSKLKETP